MKEKDPGNNRAGVGALSQQGGQLCATPGFRDMDTCLVLTSLRGLSLAHSWHGVRLRKLLFILILGGGGLPSAWDKVAPHCGFHSNCTRQLWGQRAFGPYGPSPTCSLCLYPFCHCEVKRHPTSYPEPQFPYLRHRNNEIACPTDIT